MILLSLSCKPQVMKGDSFITGSWLMVNINGLSCNVCPEIEFTKDGKGKITKPSKEEIGFTYTLEADVKKVMFSFEGNQPYFEETEYFYKIHTEDNLEILELTSKDGTSNYTLSREK